MKQGISKGPAICNICKRKKEVAIREQVEKGSRCGHNQCTFDKEINAFLEGKKKIKIVVPNRLPHKIKILPPITPNPHGKHE